jgi:hypothetical protein
VVSAELSNCAARARARRWRALAFGLLGLGALLPGAAALAEPVLHEYIEIGTGLDPLPPAPALHRGAEKGGSSGESRPSPSPGADPGTSGDTDPAPRPGAPYSIDRDTTRPSRVSYEDPFTPTVVPFKRTTVYDGVSADGELLVQSARLSSVPAQGSARPTDEHFYAALHLQVTAGQEVSIPSVAPGSRLVVAHANPAAKLRLLVDSAENWFLRADVTGELDVNLQVVADRRVFGSAFRDASFGELSRALPSVPAQVKQSALEVARTLGVSESARPRAAVEHLVEHFRRFRPSAKRPTGTGLALYRELALTGRGICRHRAYAFMLTALGLGIPTRMALNEAHAWVEVFDGELWHRIDLGGAAEELESADAGRPHHVEPSDPFAWPDASESGHALAERSNAAGPSAAPPPAASAANAGPAGASPGANPGAAGAANDDALREPVPPDSHLPSQDSPPAPAPPDVSSLRAAGGAERGKALFVAGRVSDEGHACSGVSVALSLSGSSGPPIPLGTLVTDARGDFSGSLVVPYQVPLGAHALLARPSSGCALEVPTR